MEFRWTGRLFRAHCDTVVRRVSGEVLEHSGKRTKPDVPRILARIAPLTP